MFPLYQLVILHIRLIAGGEQLFRCTLTVWLIICKSVTSMARYRPAYTQWIFVTLQMNVVSVALYAPKVSLTFLWEPTNFLISQKLQFLLFGLQQDVIFWKFALNCILHSLRVEKEQFVVWCGISQKDRGAHALWQYLISRIRKRER